MSSRVILIKEKDTVLIVLFNNRSFVKAGDVFFLFDIKKIVRFCVLLHQFPVHFYTDSRRKDTIRFSSHSRNLFHVNNKNGDKEH